MNDLGSRVIFRETDRNNNQMELHVIRKNVDMEPVHILKVICPSTNKIHVLRVPPNINECEKARRWTMFDPEGLYDIIKET